MQAIVDTIKNFAAWLLDALLYVPRLIFQEITDFLLPHLQTANTWMAGKLSELDSAFASLPDGIWWFIGVAQLHIGIPLILSALGIRFLIRRLPIIG